MANLGSVRAWLTASKGVLLILLLTGCAHSTGIQSAQTGGFCSARRTPAQSLQACLAGLAPTVAADEARRAADCAHDASEQLAQEYKVIGTPLFHNFMVNLGIKKRGLCYHWAEDLIGRLEALQLATLELHWGIARPGTLREHNSVVVTAKRQPFEQGIVLDAWRHSGRLYWTPVTADRYAWEEAERDPPP